MPASLRVKLGEASECERADLIAHNLDFEAAMNAAGYRKREPSKEPGTNHPTVMSAPGDVVGIRSSMGDL